MEVDEIYLDVSPPIIDIFTSADLNRVILNKVLCFDKSSVSEVTRLIRSHPFQSAEIHVPNVANVSWWYYKPKGLEPQLTSLFIHTPTFDKLQAQAYFNTSGTTVAFYKTQIENENKSSIRIGPSEYIVDPTMTFAMALFADLRVLPYEWMGVWEKIESQTQATK